MKVFLSWSGERSRRIAVALHSWLPRLLPDLEPWVSPEDLPKGSAWSPALAAQLRDADFGVVCVTPDNVNAQWLSFEAGVLVTSGEDMALAPVLFGLSRAELTGPLAQYQVTDFEADDFLRLLITLNRRLGGDAFPEAQLRARFAELWPSLEYPILECLGHPEGQASYESTESDIPYEPDGDDEQVLELLANLPDRKDRDWIDVDDVKKELGVSTRTAEYVLMNLTDAGLLYEDDEVDEWRLSSDGVRYVVEHGLVDD